VLSTSERIRILRLVSIFQGTPDDVLTEVASLLQPTVYQAGELIFAKGDPGDCMYIVVDGRVRVHDGDRTLDEQRPYDIFGEMSLLDEEKRSASVTALETTELLRLDQVPFYQLMISRAEVARGLIRVLSRYLRVCLRDMAQDFAYIQQMQKLIEAAADLETGNYQKECLEEVAVRPDALGQLARVFRRMAEEIVAREQRLKQQVRELRIEIDAVKREKQVEQIAETDYFRELEKKVDVLRSSIHSADEQK
jgi:CRP-like cAMP-binding protein